MNGVIATQSILKIKPSVKILVNTFSVNSELLKDMILAGASGFIMKGESREKYIEAFETVVNGSSFLSDKINHKIYDKALAYLKFPKKKMILT